MRYIIKIMMVLLLLSCGQNGPSSDEIIDSNPYLIGNWTGVGGFMDMKFAKSMGDVPFNILITKDHEITGTIGEAQINNMKISVASYGFGIKGILNSTIKEGVDFDKDHIIILLVLPEDNRQNVSSSSANFHLKTNYIFDFSMRVGGVQLVKE
jgi:hypothetical protein